MTEYHVTVTDADGVVFDTFTVDVQPVSRHYATMANVLHEATELARHGRTEWPSEDEEEES